VRLNIVHPQHVDASMVSDTGQRQRARKSVSWVVVSGQMADDAFAGNTPEERNVFLSPYLLARLQQLDVVMLCFSKSDARVEHDEFGWMALVNQGAMFGKQRLGDLVRTILVGWMALHGARLALHVHHAYGASGVEHDLHHGWVPKPRNIVDHVRSGFKRCSGHLGTARVNGNER